MVYIDDAVDTADIVTIRYVIAVDITTTHQGCMGCVVHDGMPKVLFEGRYAIAIAVIAIGKIPPKQKRSPNVDLS